MGQGGTYGQQQHDGYYPQGQQQQQQQHPNYHSPQQQQHASWDQQQQQQQYAPDDQEQYDPLGYAQHQDSITTQNTSLPHAHASSPMRRLRKPLDFSSPIAPRSDASSPDGGGDGGGAGHGHRQQQQPMSSPQSPADSEAQRPSSRMAFRGAGPNASSFRQRTKYI